MSNVVCKVIEIESIYKLAANAFRCAMLLFGSANGGLLTRCGLANAAGNSSRVQHLQRFHAVVENAVENLCHWCVEN